MSEENNQAAELEQNKEAGVIEDAGSQDEDHARELGWKPQDEWKGDPSKWVPADTFLRIADKNMPILKQNNLQLTRELDRMKTTLKELNGWREKAEKQGYDRGRNEVLEEMRKAAESGDVEGFDKAKGKLDKLEDERPTPKQADEPKKQDPAIEKMVEDNPWIIRMTPGKRRVLGEFVDEEVAAGYTLEEATERAVETFGKAFPDLVPRRRAAPRVEGSRPSTPARKKEITAADLPEEVRAVGARLVKAGAYKTIDEYAKDYIEMNGGK